MKILVTGSEGFIGKALVARLAAGQNEVFTVDRTPSTRNNNIEIVHRTGNLADVEFTKALLISLGPLDLVYHLAGQSSAEASMKNRQTDFNDNYLSTKFLIENVLGNPHVIYASTMAVYGDSSQIAEENQIPRPVSNYGLHKRMSERLLNRARAKSNVTIARLFNVYGPGQNLERLDQGMVSIYAAMAIKDDVFQVKGPLSRVRDLVHIIDAVDMLCKLGESPKGEYLIVNLSSGSLITVKEILSLIERTMKRSIATVVLARTRGDVMGFPGSVDKRKELLGMRELTPASKGIESYISSLMSM